MNNFAGLHVYYQHTHKRACNQNFAKGEGLKVKIFCLKNTLIRWQAEQSVATQSSHIDGNLGAKPLLLGEFFDFSRKNSYINAI